jgi:hypothetical protein
MEESSTTFNDMGLMLLPTHVNGVVKIVGSMMDWFYLEKCWVRESNIQFMYLASYWMGYSSFQDGELLLCYLLQQNALYCLCGFLTGTLTHG